MINQKVDDSIEDMIGRWREKAKKYIKEYNRDIGFMVLGKTDKWRERSILGGGMVCWKGKELMFEQKLDLKI